MENEAFLLDLPEPFLPTRAYRWPALSLSLVLASVSTPSLRAFAFALAPDAFFPPSVFLSPAVTVMWRPSTSNYMHSAMRQNPL